MGVLLLAKDFALPLKIAFLSGLGKSVSPWRETAGDTDLELIRK